MMALAMLISMVVGDGRGNDIDDVDDVGERHDDDHDHRNDDDDGLSVG